MGALTGALFGGLGGAGEALGSLGKLGTTCKALETLKNVAKISGTISLGMGTFDLLAWGAGLFAPDNAFTAFNQQLHSNGLYNAFQFGASALAVFSLGGIKGFYEKTPNPVCFVAGTMVLTASGLTAIEKIRAGDKVISTNAETFETEEKLVLETYIRQTDKLIHLVINGEEIITTETHPFYVKDRGFVDAGELLVGDSLLDVHGNVLLIEDIQIEYPQEPTTVYNFQVEDFHTYYVGEQFVLVHNAGDIYSRPSKFRKGIREKVWNDAKEATPDGVVRDPLTGAAMDQNEPWHMGHKPGYEFRKHRASAMERKITREQFINEHNDPSHYRPELPKSNLSHKGEDHTGIYLGP